MTPLRPLRFEPSATFVVDGEERELRDPEGPPSYRQLLLLNDLRALAIVEPGREAISAADAAGALDELVRRVEADEPWPDPLDEESD